MNGELLFRAVCRALVLPPGGPVLLALAGLGLQRARPRLGRGLVALGLGVLLALSMPVVADALSLAVQRYPPLDPARLPPADLIVVLGGGSSRNSDDPTGPVPTLATLERLATAARLARASGLPVLVSGGTVDVGEPEAFAMQRALRQDFGVEVRWVEPRSRTTEENATETAKLLKPLGLGHPLLVTSAIHMRRSVAEFRAAGLDPVPAPTAGTAHLGGGGLRGYLPSPAALDRSSAALYEAAGECVAWLSGRR